MGNRAFAHGGHNLEPTQSSRPIAIASRQGTMTAQTAIVRYKWATADLHDPLVILVRQACPGQMHAGPIHVLLANSDLHLGAQPAAVFAFAHKDVVISPPTPPAPRALGRV